MKSSWKTTVGGVFGSIGTAVTGFAHDDVVKSIGVIVTGLSMLLLGLAARDNGVTSERAGAQ